MKLNKKLEVSTEGTPSLDHLTEGEQKTFYLALLAHILDERRKQLEMASKDGGDAV